MSSKKPVKKTVLKKPVAKEEAMFVIKFHSMLTDSGFSYNGPMFYSFSGQGWVNDIGSATRFRKGAADKVMLELLQNDKVASELVDLSQKPENLFSHNTVFLGPGLGWEYARNIPYIITKVPQFVGDSYSLAYYSATLSSFKNEDWSEEDLLDMLREDKFTALWDSNIGIIPENNMEFTSALGYELR